MNQPSRKRGRPTSNAEIDLERLYEIALNAFAEKGFEGTSTTEIARKAGIARSLLNYHFGNKEELWKKTIDRLNKQVVETFEHYPTTYKEKNGIDILKLMIRHQIKFMAKYPQYSQVISHEFANPSPRADWIIDSLINPFYRLTASLFKEERDNGRLKKFSRENQSSILLGMSSYFFSNSYLIRKKFNIDPFCEKEIEKHADTVVEIFFHGIVK